MLSPNNNGNNDSYDDGLSWNDYVSETTATVSEQGSVYTNPPTYSKFSEIMSYLDEKSEYSSNKSTKTSSPSSRRGNNNNNNNNKASPLRKLQQQQQQYYDSKYQDDDDDNLDMQGVEDEEDSMSQGDDISALSFTTSKANSHNSPSNRNQYKSSNSSNNSSSKYIWDTWNKNTSEIDEETKNEANTTYFSHLVGKTNDDGTVTISDDMRNMNFNGRDRDRDDVSESHHTIQTAVSDIKDKVDVMKKELKEKTLKSKKLQADYIRIKTARERKVGKETEKWEVLLRKKKEELYSQLEERKGFVQKLVKDCNELERKKITIADKMTNFKKKKQISIKNVQNSKENELVRARQQWKKDESAYFNKVLAQRNDSLQKQAADAFGPKLEQKVIEGNDKVLKREEELDRELATLKKKLQSEFHKKIEESLLASKSELKDEEERMRKDTEKQLQACLKRQSEEITDLKERFARERRRIDESAERIRQLDAEATLDGLRAIKNAESQQVKELITKQQREMSNIISRFEEDKENLRKNLDEENKIKIENYKRKLALEVERERERKLALAKSEAFAQNEAIIRKLRDEANEERTQYKDDVYKKLDDLRMDKKVEIDILTSEQQELSGQLESLRKEIDNLSDIKNQYLNENKAITYGITRKEAELEVMRNELKEISQELERLDEQFETDTKSSRDAIEQDIHVWEDKISQVEHELMQNEKKIQYDKSSLESALRAEQEQIEDKVNAVLRGKEMALGDLKRQLGEMQRQNSQLQEELEHKRDQKFANLGGDI